MEYQTYKKKVHHEAVCVFLGFFGFFFLTNKYNMINDGNNEPSLSPVAKGIATEPHN